MDTGARATGDHKLIVFLTALRALSIAETVEEPFCGVLRLLVDYDDAEVR